MVYRSPGRWLAPLALVAAAIAVYAVASGSGGDGSGEASRPSAPLRRTSPTKPRARAHRAYVVQPGDVLSQIAVKTGVSLDQIQRLNPTVEAQSLHAGQRLRLSP
jgi:LysM repeat protein